MADNQQRATGPLEALRNRFSRVQVTPIEHEDRLPEEDARSIWTDIQQLFGAATETARDEVKVAVYGYYAVNGTSKVGKHSRDITANGLSVPANDVRKCIVGGTPRQFLRANVQEAYIALKESGVLEEDEVFSQLCVDKGVPRGFEYCAVDYLRGCSEFTPEEKSYADKAFSVSISRAKAARGGRQLEEISDSQNKERATVGGTDKAYDSDY